MIFQIEFKPRAVEDLRSISKNHATRIFGKIEALQHGLSGDVRRLTHFTPEYRLRVGDYRVLFEVDDDKIIIYRVKHRKDAYR